MTELVFGERNSSALYSTVSINTHWFSPAQLVCVEHFLTQSFKVSGALTALRYEKKMAAWEKSCVFLPHFSSDKFNTKYWRSDWQ